MVIDYLGHSGFLVETGRQLLLFDYYRGDLSILEQKPTDKPLFVFVSHAHPDHFNPAIFELTGRAVHYLLSFDLHGSRDVPQTADVTWLEADMAYEIPDLGTVRTLRSTDEGVAFLVDTGGETLFHAGDLHWWDWEGEDPDWLAEQERLFKREIGTLAGTELDAAFLVLDDRLERSFARGMAWFLSLHSPRCVLPMHFWSDRSIIERFRALPGAVPPNTRILDTVNETHWEL